MEASVVPVTDDALPKAGWYPDPSGSTVLRWWNGVSWSDATHPMAGAPAQSAPVPSYPELFDSGSGPYLAQGAAHSRRGLWLVLGTLGVLLAAAVVGVVAVVSLVASSTALDTGAVEQRIAESLSAQTGQDTTVQCPDSIELAAAGQTFTCEVSAEDGTTGTVEVTQDDDAGNVTWRVVD